MKCWSQPRVGEWKLTDSESRPPSPASTIKPRPPSSRVHHQTASTIKPRPPSNRVHHHPRPPSPASTITRVHHHPRPPSNRVHHQTAQRITRRQVWHCRFGCAPPFLPVYEQDDLKDDACCHAVTGLLWRRLAPCGGSGSLVEWASLPVLGRCGPLVDPRPRKAMLRPRVRVTE